MSGLGKNVTVIPARRRGGRGIVEKSIIKTKVAAYCRVSTDSEEQETSYETQVQHYTDYIKSKPEWEFVGIYADDGISGTNTMKREGFNNMIQDCEEGKIDLILTKSISRFSRNTVDCLKYTRKLKEMNIAVFFEKENINTLDSKGEVLMTIMAALAQQESESLSANVRLGIQYRNQQGKVQVNTNWFLGYTKDEEGNLIVDKEQAEVVKRIYREYLDGKSLIQIKRGLEADGIKNGAGHTKWHESNLKQILTNEKYIGDALLQKTYTVSILDKKRAKNQGQMPKYYVEGSHEAIIDRAVFLKVQAEMTRRANLVPDGKKRIYSGKYALSGIVICAHCGDVFRRVKWNNRGCKSTVWRCMSRLHKKTSEVDCLARTIKEEELHDVVVKAINKAYYQKNMIIPILINNIKEVLDDGYEKKLEQIDKQLLQLQQELINVSNDELAVEELGNQIVCLREERQQVQMKIVERTDFESRIQEMIEFLDEQTVEIRMYNEVLVRRLVNKVLIYDDKVVVRFKSGLEIEV